VALNALPAGTVTGNGTAAPIDAALTSGTLLQISVADDGRGLPGTPRPGRGLTGIRKRAATLGAEVRWRNRPHGGLLFELELPLPPETGGAEASTSTIGSARDSDE
jgi:glucose-6-phosphate-specific signal transduction histidine kinase